jgi:hypothetical protein
MSASRLNRLNFARSSCVAFLMAAGFLAQASPASAASWLPHSLNLPSGISQVALFGVSCSATTTCTAVGQDWNGSNWGAHAESGWGSGWTPQTGVLRNPGVKNGILRGVSCVPTKPCMTAGSYGNSQGESRGMLQAQASGAWSFDGIDPSSFGVADAMNAISCASTSWCETVGWVVRVTTSYNYGGDVAFTTPPSFFDSSVLSGSNAAMNGVSCLNTNPGFCMAVGSSAPNAAAQTYNGATGWTNTAAPALANGSILRSVSCVTTSWCMAVGNYHDASGDHALAELWNGSIWTQKTLPATTTASIAYGISCVSANECHSVGAGTNDTVPQADRWNGSTWTSETAPLAPGAGSAALKGVSCPATNNCEAAGWSKFGGVFTGLIETYS